jgi:VPDSG-CTERM motif
MKALPKKLLPLTLFGIAVTSLFCVQPAQAFTITLEQVGSNVVATGSGAFNLTGLTLSPGQFVGTRIAASFAIITMSPELVNADAYNGFTGPTSFGSGGLFSADSFSGDVFAFDGTGAFGGLFLLQGYVSGTALSNSMTFNNATLASLGVTPGTYVWSWGTGLPNQDFTLIIGGAGVPDGGSTVSLLGFGLLGLAALRRKLDF